MVAIDPAQFRMDDRPPPQVAKDLLAIQVSAPDEYGCLGTFREYLDEKSGFQNTIPADLLKILPGKPKQHQRHVKVLLDCLEEIAAGNTPSKMEKRFLMDAMFGISVIYRNLRDRRVDLESRSQMDERQWQEYYEKEVRVRKHRAEHILYDDPKETSVRPYEPLRDDIEQHVRDEIKYLCERQAHDALALERLETAMSDVHALFGRFGIKTPLPERGGVII